MVVWETRYWHSTDNRITSKNHITGRQVTQCRQVGGYVAIGQAGTGRQEGGGQGSRPSGRSYQNKEWYLYRKYRHEGRTRSHHHQVGPREQEYDEGMR